MDNAQLLARLDAAFKSVTDISDAGDSVLAPQKFDRFVRVMQDGASIIPAARFIPMDAQQVEIDRTGFIGRILRSGADGTGASRTLSTSDFAKPQFSTNKLIAQELQAITSLKDRLLRRNIERGNFEATLVDLFGEAAGRDFEEYALFGDTDWSHGDDDVLSKTDGWLKKAGNKVYGRDVAGQVAADFDPTDAEFPENMFQAMLDALPKQFVQNRTEWRFYVTFDVFDAYVNLLRVRETALGDETTTGHAEQRPWKGFVVERAPMLERFKTVNLSSDPQVIRERVEGQCALLTHPNNMAWGVFHEVTIEPEREAKDRRTDFVLTIEADVHYEDENAAVAAFIDKANPEADGS